MEEIKKLAYVQPTLTKVVLTTNERIAAGVCENDGPLPPEICGDVAPQATPDEPS